MIKEQSGQRRAATETNRLRVSDRFDARAPKLSCLPYSTANPTQYVLGPIFLLANIIDRKMWKHGVRVMAMSVTSAGMILTTVPTAMRSICIRDECSGL